MTAVCVIGGGIAGLSAARRLAQADADVVVLERDRLGGKLRTSSFAGRPVDEGADAFLARVPWATDLARDLGLGDDLVAPAERSAYVFVDGTLRPLPAEHVLGVPTNPDGLAATGILTPDGVAAVRRDLDDPGPPPTDDEAIGPFIRRRLGDEVLDRLVGPLVGGINAGDVERLSLAAVTPQLDALARHREPSLVRAGAALRVQAPPGDAAVFFSPRQGMGHLVDRLVADLTTRGVAMRLGATGEAIEPMPGRDRGWRVQTSTGEGLDVDAVVIAVPGRGAGDLLTGLAPTAAEFLVGLDYAPVVLVTLAVDPDAVGRPLDGSGFLVARSAGLLLTACSWTSAKWAHLAPARGDGTALLRASAGRDGDRRAADLGDDELVARLVDDLAQTMALRGAPTAVRVSRWPRSFPQYRPGHLDRVADAEADLVLRVPTIALAGASLRGVGVPACIKSGTDAADRVLAALRLTAR